jgi:hypothetical protein
MEEKYKELIERLTVEIFEGAVNLYEPSQLNSELKKDIAQDLWLELYSHIAAYPDANLESVEDVLKKMRVASLPDLRMVYVDPETILPQ